MKRPRGMAAAPARDVEGACFLAWLDAPEGAGGAPQLCVGELHFSNASHMPRDTPVEQLYGVLFQLRARADGFWTHDGGFPWRVVPLACTVAARLGRAAADGLAWRLDNAAEASKRLEEMGEVAPAEYEADDPPSAAAVVGASRPRRGGCRALTRRAQRGWTHGWRAARNAAVRPAARERSCKRRRRSHERSCASLHAGWDLSRIPAADRTSAEVRMRVQLPQPPRLTRQCDATRCWPELRTRS